MKNNIVEQKIESAFSPRCQDSIFWDTNHKGGFVIPTEKHIPTDDEQRHSITTDDRKELSVLDIKFRKRFLNTAPEMRLSAGI